MTPYILSVLINSRDLQTVPSICRRISHFNVNPKRSDKDNESYVKHALQSAIEIGIVRKDSKRNAYGLTNKWFIPETQHFHAQLHEIVQSMPFALNDSTAQTQASGQQMECMGPGMRQRSPAQIRAIAIYRRMREQRERDEREAAARAKKRSNSKSRSRSRTRRASSGTRSRSKRRSSTRSRSRSRKPRSRNVSRR